ncbi:MAG: hypothetical protein ACREBG_03525 [Pyrinomonadaceae bacterium]
MSPETKDLAEVLAHWATAAGVLGGLITLLLGWRTYVQQGNQKRVEFYFDIWDQLRSMPGHGWICEAIDAQQWAMLTEVSVSDRREKFFFFEQVALLVNPGFLHPHIAYYMFGYHAIRCWDHEEYWPGLPEKRYWKLLQSFVEQMREVERLPWKKRRKRF